MKIEITQMAITQHGTFDKGDILTDEKFPVAFLQHLAGPCNAAEIIDYDTKVDPGYETPEKKSESQSTQSSEPEKASQKTTARSRKKKRPSSQ